LVDDLPDNLIALEALLERPDLVLLKARSGREALELLLDHDVALALIDVQMPEIDGFEVAELMRGSERTRHVPIILVTAGLRDQHRVFKGYDAGAVDFLYKPLDPRILKHKAETFFQLYRQRQELSRRFELLRESEEFQNRMIEASQDFIGVLEKEGRIVAALGGFRKLFGEHERPDAIGGDWAEIWREADRGSARAAIESAQHGELGRFVAESALAASAGTHWDVAITPVRDAKGQIDRLLAVARDVTTQRKTQEDRDRLTRELEETLRFNETFVAIVGHDLRNPLNVMVMAGEILSRRLTDPSLKRTAEQVRASGKRMMSMLDDLADLARARLSGGIVVQREPGDFLARARKVVAEHRAANPERTLELRAEGNFEGAWDGPRIEQLLSNLIANALRHGARDCCVTVELDGRAEDVVLASVHNAGHIPPELLPHVFHPFRSGNARRDRGDGLGLGLFIVSQLVAAHAGEITVHSTAETGTTFRLEFPRGLDRERPPLAAGNATH
jgi:PAS domain S-box-containing protein